MTWQAALTYVACLNTNTYLGHNDWRMPNINELESLVNQGVPLTGVWLNNQGFYQTQTTDYWSSTTDASDTTRAWGVDLADGCVNGDPKASNYFIKSVRGGQCKLFGSSICLPKTGQTTTYAAGDDGSLQEGVTWPSQRFTDNGDGTVTDNLTSLTWTKNANAPGPAACSPGVTKTWLGALAYAACLNANNYLGHNDWRLPNRKELFSLKDYSQYNTSLPAGNPFINVNPNEYWTSTMDSYYGSAWIESFYDGYVGTDFTNYDYFNVWCVRSGLSLFDLIDLVTPSAGSGGSITPSTPQIAIYGLMTTTFTLTPAAGYGISSVTGCGGILSGNTYTTERITNDCGVSVSFATNSITASANKGGSISPSGVTWVPNGDSQSYTITPNTGYQITNVLVDGVSVGAVSSYTFTNVTGNHTIAATFAAATVVLAINAGGPEYTSKAGVNFEADTDYSGGATYSTTTAIAGTSDPTLYQTERYSNFSYNIPLANGNYYVILKFAETYWNAAGERVFNVSTQGTQVISNLDIFYQVGQYAAYDVAIPVSVTNGNLNITFSSVVSGAIVSAIEVTQTH
jgi:hypothetical protein